MRSTIMLFFTLCLTVFLGISGCGGDAAGPDPSDSNNIITGGSTELISQPIPGSGGSLILGKPGNPLDGIMIEVPQGAYPGSRTFRISSSPIEKHSFGDAFNPITPLIRIENGGDYASEPMILDIPVKIPSGHFAMAFAYDRRTGRLEGMPLVDYDSTHITIATSHFSQSGIEPGSSGIDGIIAGGSDASEIVVSSIPEAMLKDPYDSGFRPGTDDWQFPNYGSILARNGHCAGQSLGMLWYYKYQRQRGNSVLWNCFGNVDPHTPDLWQDDTAAYRFCSIIQKKIDWTSITRGLQYHAQTALPASVTYNLFAYSLRLTHQPQYLSVASTASPQSGHALVVYAVSNGIISICDPNYQGVKDRNTEFSLGHFLPYYSGPDARNLGIKYNIFRYVGQFSLINPKIISKHYSEMLSGNIGNDIFPQLKLMALNDKSEFVPLADGFSTEHDRVRLLPFSIEDTLKIAAVWTADLSTVPVVDNEIVLKPGTHKYGIYVTTDNDDWTGFRWVRITSTKSPDQTGNVCSSTLTVDGKPIALEQNSSLYYLSLPGDFFTVTASWINSKSGALDNCVTVSTIQLTEPGVYDLDAARSFASIDHITGDYTSEYRLIGGRITLTRYDTRVEGSYTFTGINNITAKTITASGTFSCKRQ